MPPLCFVDRDPVARDQSGKLLGTELGLLAKGCPPDPGVAVSVNPSDPGGHVHAQVVRTQPSAICVARSSLE